MRPHVLKGSSGSTLFAKVINCSQNLIIDNGQIDLLYLVMSWIFYIVLLCDYVVSF